MPLNENNLSYSKKDVTYVIIPVHSWNWLLFGNILLQISNHYFLIKLFFQVIQKRLGCENQKLSC